ncbi:sigma-70 family RNA polymerase sigma factor [Bacillus paralicheniformis]|nr:sigma-70 family RNA polymerase sigma factor [Bacillus paralicheniformis]
MKLEEVYKSIQPSVYAFFYVKTFHKETAEDLTQEVFYQAVKGYHTFSGKSTIKTWVFAIAKNVLKKHFRSGASKAGTNMIFQHEEAACLSPEEHLLKTEKERRLLEEINRLLWYAVLGLAVYLFYRDMKLVILLSFAPIFIWGMGDILAGWDAADGTGVVEHLLYSVFGAFMLAVIHCFSPRPG